VSEKTGLYLFALDGGTSATYCYFTADSPRDVLRKYPVLTFVEDEWAWMTDEWKESVKRRRLFDVDDNPEVHGGFLQALKQASDAYRSSLGEQVLPPRE
jgi:hypothetical protein